MAAWILIMNIVAKLAAANKLSRLSLDRLRIMSDVFQCRHNFTFGRFMNEYLILVEKYVYKHGLSI